ncbi:hypothetical protein [Nocardia cyriacigeorgica]|uniref:hypothetical protein n=1 Tax=Nocardia cyriacigeorgica TaxID=135487 RepID=UPI002453C3AC|nr:hypothetical protein [Nocardia cyriacigeorgica]
MAPVTRVGIVLSVLALGILAASILLQIINDRPAMLVAVTTAVWVALAASTSVGARRALVHPRH